MDKLEELKSENSNIKIQHLDSTNKEAVERYPLLHRDQVVTNMDDEEMDDGSISQGNAPNYDDETFPNVIIDQSIEYPNTNFGHSSSIMNNNDDIATTF